MKKKTFKSLLAIICLLSSTSASAYDFEVDGFYYEVNLETATATLVAGDLPYEGAISVPQNVVYKGRNFIVTSIDGAFINCVSLTSVKVPDGILSLGNETFKDCSSLSEIEGLNDVTEIGESCFSGCTSLASISLPENLTLINSYAFSGCINLVDIKIPKSVISIGDYAFYRCENLKSVNLPTNLTIIPSGLFRNCKSITEIDIPSHVKSIHSYAFQGCTSITEMSIPADVSEIKEGAFSDCTSLSKIIFQESSSTLDLGSSASILFSGCPIETAIIGRNLIGACFYKNRHLKKVSLSMNVTYIVDKAFYECTNLSNIVIPRSVVNIGEWCFYNSGLDEVIFEDGYDDLLCKLEVPSWDYKTPHIFVGCNITSIYLGRNITISGGAQNPGYGGNPSTFFPTTLQSLIIGDIVDNISSLLLYNQKQISSLSHYPNLKSVQFGVNITQVPNLSENKNLNKISLNAILPPNANPFSNSQYMDMEVFVPIGTKAVYETANIWKNFWNITEDESLLTCIENDGLLYHIISNNSLEVMKKTTEYSGNINVPEKVEFNGVTYNVVSIGEAFKACSNLLSISIPSSVTTLNNNCLKDCSNLTTVLMPESIKEIPINAFSGCKKLTQINIPTSLTSIQSSSFKGCSSLTEFNCPQSLDIIGEEVFADCTSLVSFKFNNEITSIGSSIFSGCRNLQEIAFPQNVKIIPASCFNGCSNLTSIINSDNITRIEENAFEGCTAIMSLSFPNILSVSDNSFKNCTSLNSVLLGYNLTTIGSGAFTNCKSLTVITIPRSVTNIGKSIFSGCIGLKELIFEDGTSPLTLPSGSYDTSTNILKKEVNGKTIQYKIQYYNGYFNGLPLEKLYLGRNLSNDSRYTISGNGGVDYYLITVYDTPFYSLSNLNEMTIGENVTTIGPAEEFIPEVELYVTAGAFKNCNELQTIYVKNPIPPSGAEFSSSVYSNAKLYIPANTASLYSVAEGWKNFWNIQECETAGIEHIVSKGQIAKEVKCYDTTGREINSLQKGLNIIRMSDGTIKKVLIK